MNSDEMFGGLGSNKGIRLFWRKHAQQDFDRRGILYLFPNFDYHNDCVGELEKEFVGIRQLALVTNSPFIKQL